MRLLIISFFLSVTLSAQTKKFVVVQGTPSTKISFIGTGDSTQITVPRVWLAYDLKYNQHDSFPSVSLETYRTYQTFLNEQPIPTNLATSSYKYRGMLLADSVVADIRRYFIGLGFQAGVIQK